MTTPEFACVGSIIIDDIVYPDGRTDMAVLGGGGTHTAAGMVAVSVRPALLACLGTDVPPEITARLERDFDMRYATRLNMPQIRAWQVFEWNGRRTEIFRVDDYLRFLVEPTPDTIPATVRDVSAVTVLRGADEFLRFCDVFPNAEILWEPDQHFMVPENRKALVAALPRAAVVSPNLLEAGQVYGENDPAALVRRLLADGANVVALRLGEAGSLVGRRGVSDLIHIPVVPVKQVVDVTGAGNTYCGAFLVGWHQTHDLRTAGCYGAVAASFTVEQVGVLDTSIIPDFQRARDERLAWALAQ
ncbi:MAG: hypothetical protein H6671_09515 [Anaerolineaceae bacterium]|nr:hypothetical protein [Anaerolineaceae bacterium]